MSEAVVTHTQRAVMEAVDALTRVEDALRGRVQAPDVMTKINDLIETLQLLVSKTTEGHRDAAADYEQAQAALSEESSTRGAAQAERARLCAG